MYCIYMRTFWWIFYLDYGLGKYMTMKVYEIISEATGSVTVSGDPAVLDRIEALSKQLGMNTKKEAIKTGLLSKWTASMPTWLGTALKLVGFSIITGELLYNLSVLDQAFVSGKIKTRAEYENERQYAIGYWQIQLLVPWIVKWLRRQKALIIIIGAITGFLTIGAGLGIGAAVISLLGGAAIDWTIAAGIEAFLMSSAGQEWMRQAFTAIALFGRIGDELINEIETLVTGKSHEDNIADKRKRENPAADAADVKADQARQKSDFGPKSVKIDGNLVVDQDGYKVPGAAFGLENYMKLNPSDPLVMRYKAAPTRPGHSS